MGYMLDALFVFAFFMFFICSIVFMQILPTSNYIWSNLATSPPTFTSFDAWTMLVQGFALVGWIFSKMGLLLLFFLNILIIPFSMMFSWSYLSPLLIPLVAIFLYGLFDRVWPWLFQALKIVVDTAIGIIQAIAEAIPF